MDLEQSTTYSMQHPHEPEIPPALDSEGRCHVCLLTVRAENAEAALVRLVDQHHRTLTGSKLHKSAVQDWPECECKTCAAIAELLPEQAQAALVRYRAEREAR